MEGREQKISGDNYRQKNRTVSKSYVGVQTYIGMTANRLTEVQFTREGLLEQILSPTNLNKAYKRVVSNKGIGGVDKMTTGELLSYLRTHGDELISSLYNGTYRPDPVLRVEIPKDNGKKRQLGIPTVVDRLVQQAIHQVLVPLYEQEFSDSSYGFRPNRGAHQALHQVQKDINAGYTYCVDIDFARFFDTVNQSKLIEVLSRKIKDGRLISLIHKFLRSGVMNGFVYEPHSEGVPQGSPLSPLLGNIMLNELDKELENRGHRFVRYADDIIILCRSERGAQRVKSSIVRYIEKKLYLQINEEKTVVGSIVGVKFLGYTFYKSKNRGEYRLLVHPKSVQKLKFKLKELTKRSNGMSYARRKHSLHEFARGWVQYFKLADMASLLRDVDGWLRRRIRMCIWKSWKCIGTRYKCLLKCRIDKSRALQTAFTRKGYWRTTRNPVIQEAMSNDRLRERGYPFLLDYYHREKHRK